MTLVIVAYDMERQLERTLRSVGAQIGLEPGSLEVIVVDNGSPTPVPSGLVRDLPWPGRIIRREAGDVSPARAANEGLAQARGGLVGLIIDGARILSPGLVAWALRAAQLFDRIVVTAPAWHVGPTPQGGGGHERIELEERLLCDFDQAGDGYSLFAMSTLAPSSGRGWFGPMGESSSLFLSASDWKELGGLDERFTSPGGGLVNHDLYRRACSLSDAELVVLLGEGTFHQSHGGAATGGDTDRSVMKAEYERIVGRPHRPPLRRPVYLGHLPAPAVQHLPDIADRAVRWEARRPG